MTYKLIVKQEAVEDTANVYKWYEDQLAGLGLEFESALDAVYDYWKNIPIIIRFSTKITAKAG